MRFILLLSLTLACCSVVAQPLYEMTDALVDDCKGFLTDSEAGSLPGHYDHDENYTFTICVPGASSISMNFTAFCLEDGFDFLRIFDGPDTFATQIGPAYTGLNIPPNITTTSGCLTIHFESDANVSCTGWVAQWTTQIESPVLPQMSLPNPAPTCSTNVLVINFDTPVPCDSLIPGAFTINGPLGLVVANSTPINCMNDSTTEVELNLIPGLNQSGMYYFTYTSFFVDQCDSLWILTTTDSMAIIDCPLIINLTATPDTICQGECTDLFVDVEGGDFQNYQYNWSVGLPNGPGPYQVCPLDTTTYWVTVSDGTGAMASDTVEVIVWPAPTMPADTTVCQSDPPFNLSAVPAGGAWAGDGIVNAGLGTFDPGDAGGGTHTVTYYDPKGCPAEMEVTVLEIDPGPTDATCPGAFPWPVGGFSPPGGTWSGPNISPGGTFTPPAVPGVFVVTYTVGGCSADKTIHVDFPVITVADTVCESEPDFFLTATPPGGTWTGPGVQNAQTGYFDPGAANIGDNTITYNLKGCDASVNVYIKEIWWPNDNAACPEQAPYSLGPGDPAGGIWTSTQGSITDPVNGIFDPGTMGGMNYNDTITYTFDGCSRTRVIYIRQTVVGVDTLDFCLSDPIMELDWANTQRSPWDGDWFGPGVIDPDWPGEFDPSVAGPGNHTLVYDANTCIDSIVMVVHPPAISGDTSVCEITSPFTLTAEPPGGIWAGNGITNMNTGLFDPGAAGVGTFTIYYQSPFSCLDSMQVEVTALPVLSIDNLEAQYCYKDSGYALVASPPGGFFNGPGISNNIFNPADAGAGGPHMITYTFGVGECQQTVTGITNVSPPLEVSLSMLADTICPGEFRSFSAFGSGGGTGAYFYHWNQGLGNGSSQTVLPDQTTTYTVTVRDGCSDPVSASLEIVVNPSFSLTFAQSDPVCYGEQGFAVAQVQGPNQYEIEWQTSPPQFGDTLFAPTGFGYEVLVRDIFTDCMISGEAEILRYPYVNAQFLDNPNEGCQRLDNPEFTFVDQSVGGFVGYWDFGDGTMQDYMIGQDIRHSYSGLGEYQVSLYIENEGGCSDTFSVSVCIIPPESYIWVPNAFSPNGDDINDDFFIQSQGFESYELQIFDRWGKAVFISNDPADKWDGRYMGNGPAVPEGVYTWVIRGMQVSNNPRINYKTLSYYDFGSITLYR